MNIHKNARLTPRGRERIVRQVASGQTPEAVAEAVGVCPRTVRKWVDRYRFEGLAGLQDRSSRPHRLRRPTPQAAVEEVERLRRQRWTGKQIAAATGVSPAKRLSTRSAFLLLPRPIQLPIVQRQLHPLFDFRFHPIHGRFPIEIFAKVGGVHRRQPCRRLLEVVLAHDGAAKGVVTQHMPSAHGQTVVLDNSS